MIIKYTIIVFITQLVFIGCRTWNVKAIAEKNIPMVLTSGVFVNLSWLVSIAIGSVSTYEIVSKGQWDYWPVIVASVIGSSIGSYIALKRK